MTETNELEALCMRCPSQREVSATLRSLGFHLTFQMPASRRPLSLAALPAQFHYSDARGTEVIYLAGRDTDPDGRRLPPHQSRFWLYPDFDPAAFQRAARL